jgi:metallo-beta-lactamase class B
MKTAQPFIVAIAVVSIALLNNPRYPNIVADFEKGFRTLRSLKPDLFFVSHGNQFGMTERLERMNQGEGLKPFMEGYKEYLDEYENAFIEQVKVEKACGPAYAIGTKPLPPCPQDGRKCY